MYNSIIVGGLVKLWNLFYSSYENSLLKKIVDKIESFFSYLFQYSKTKRIFTSKDSLISKSLFFKGIKKTVLLIDKILEGIYKGIANLCSGSWLCKSIYGGFKDKEHILKIWSVFGISLFVGILGNSLFVFRQGSVRIYITSILFILIFVFLFGISNNYKKMLDNSHMWGFISGLFKIDEGGEQWW